MALILLFILIFASGFASLLYQVLWARQLAIVLGSTVYAISTVLAAFMCGLGLGSLWFGSRVDRSKWPALRMYGAIELGIAGTAVLFQVGLSILPWIYGPLYSLREIPQLYHFTRFILVFALIAGPTFLMGGTLPVLANLTIGRNRARNIAGWLYGVNTAGAAAGAFAAGFLLIESLGVPGTSWFAVSINAAVGLISLALRLPLEKSHGHREEVGEPVFESADPGLGLTVYALSGFVALGMENVWSRSLVFAIGSTTYAFSIMLVLLLIGLALGSILASEITKRRSNPLPWIVAGQMIIAMLSAAALWVFLGAAAGVREWLHFNEEMPWVRKLAVQVLEASILVLPGAVIFGAMFPLAARMAIRASAAGSGMGRLLGANTLAAIAGSLLTGFVLIPMMGIHRSYLILGTVSASAALYALVRVRRWIPAGGVLAVWILAVAFAPAQLALEPLRATQKLVFYKEGPSGTISVVEDYGGDRRLLIDHIAVAGTDLVFMTDQKSLAHLPMLLHPAPKKALTIGFGSGGASYSFSLYPELEAVHAVEIDPTVLQAAPAFEKINGRILENPRFRVIHDDARSYLLYSKERYDIITTDCTDLRYKSSALLYTREFFESTKLRLNSGGIVVAWVPLGGLRLDDLKTVVRTFAESFPESSGWYMYNYPTHYLLLVGSSEPLRFDLDLVKTRIAVPSVMQDLAEIGLTDPLKILGGYLRSHRQMLEFAEGGAINSDERPVLEFSVPKSGSQFTVADNLEAFARETSDPSELLDSPLNLETLLRARSLIIQGHVVYNRWNNQYRSAVELYEQALKINPADRTIETLIRATVGNARVQKEEYEKLIALNEGDYNTYNELGLLLEYEDDLNGAMNAFRTAAEMAPGRPEIRVNMGRIFDRKKMWPESIEMYKSALALDIDLADAWSNLGFVYLEQDRNADAAAAFERAVALRDDPRFWFNLGLARLDLGDMTRSRQALDRAIELNTAFSEAFLTRGVVRLRLNDLDGAASDLNSALQHRSEYAEAHYNLGIVEERRQKLDRAAQHYLRATQIDPRHVLAYNNLGILYSLARRPAEAIATYLKAIAIDGRNAQLRNNLAMEYARTGNFTKAINEYEEAIRLEPKMFEPYANLALIYARTNRTAEAEKYLSLARKMNPDFRLP
ncbi:MAG: fused MFS/spermidine synthase [Acidobacteria bacterium]|nr:fused MFS/spermidine synthase [Acidobacteriota bacterium]